MKDKLLFGFVSLLLIALPVLAANTDNGADHRYYQIHSVKHDVGRPLRDLPPAPRAAGVKKIRPNYDAPLGTIDSTIRLDEALQTASAPSASAPSSSANFEGIGEGLGSYNAIYVPPDTNGDIGDTQYVQIVNTDLAVFSKTGTVLYGPVPTSTLWSGFGGACETHNDGDATVTYDQFANRWILAQFTSSKDGNRQYWECVAVSTGSNAVTSSWNRYAYSFSSLPDYPKVAVWPSANAFFATYNMFGGTFKGANVCAMDRTKMLGGQANSQQCVQLSSSYYSLLAADLDGSLQPAAGTDEYVLSAYNGVKVWRFHVDWAAPANTQITGPTSIAVAGYTESCSGSSGNCVPQKGTTVVLDTLGVHMMNRAAYRVFGDGHHALVANHTVSTSGINAVRWYEFTPSGSSLVVAQQGTYSPDSDHRWMASIAIDQSGNIGMGYSASSSSINPAIRYTGRAASDAAGQMQTEATIINGTGSQNQYSRWGDYSSIQTDPGDDCTFWFTTEYLSQNGSFNWHTRIASFKFSTCGGGTTNNPPTASFNYSCTGLGCNFTDTSTDSDGSIVSRSWNFGDGQTSTATNPSHTYASGNTYTVSLTVTDNGGATGNTSQSVTVSSGGGGFTLTASGYKVRGVQHATLSWTGASGNVDIYRDNAVISANQSGDTYDDNINAKGAGTYIYKVCNTGTTTCSNEATVVF
jgi:PKD repeat protein